MNSKSTNRPKLPRPSPFGSIRLAKLQNRLCHSYISMRRSELAHTAPRPPEAQTTSACSGPEAPPCTRRAPHPQNQMSEPSGGPPSSASQTERAPSLSPWTHPRPPQAVPPGESPPLCPTPQRGYPDQTPQRTAGNCHARPRDPLGHKPKRVRRQVVSFVEPALVRGAGPEIGLKSWPLISKSTHSSRPSAFLHLVLRQESNKKGTVDGRKTDLMPHSSNMSGRRPSLTEIYDLKDLLQRRGQGLEIPDQTQSEMIL